MTAFNKLQVNFIWTVVRGRGQAKDVQINKSHSPLLLSILHGEGNEKAGEGIINLSLPCFHNYVIKQMFNLAE